MTLALRMREQGHDVVVLEGARAAGGLASSQQIAGYTWDRFYHVILQSDRDLLALLRDLGVDEPQWGVTRTGFYTDGVLYSLSTSLEFLAFPPLSLFDKNASRRDHRVRVAREGLAAARENPGVRLAAEAERQAHVRAHLAAAAQEQARRELPHRERRVHLGDHRAHVRRTSLGPQARAVRLRERRLRDRARALRALSRREGDRAAHRCPRRRRARFRLRSGGHLRRRHLGALRSRHPHAAGQSHPRARPAARARRA